MVEDHSEKFVVQIDSDLKDLIPGFLAGRQQDVKTIRVSIENNDFDTIHLIGHSMKGNGAGYGFDELTDIGREIEEAAKSQSVEGVVESLDKLTVYLKNVEVQYV